MCVCFRIAEGLKQEDPWGLGWGGAKYKVMVNSLQHNTHRGDGCAQANQISVRVSDCELPLSVGISAQGERKARSGFRHTLRLASESAGRSARTAKRRALLPFFVGGCFLRGSTRTCRSESPITGDWDLPKRNQQAPPQRLGKPVRSGDWVGLTSGKGHQRVLRITTRLAWEPCRWSRERRGDPRGRGNQGVRERLRSS